MVKGSILWRVLLLLIYAPSIEAPEYSKKKSHRSAGENSNAIIIRDFSIPLSTTEKSSRQRINKKIMEIMNDVKLENKKRRTLENLSVN